MTPDIIIRGERHRFVPHSGQALGETSKLDLFAECLAEGCSPVEAAATVYGTKTVGNAMLQRIRQRLGPQAI